MLTVTSLFLFLPTILSQHNCDWHNNRICELSISRCERDCLLYNANTTETKYCLIGCLFTPSQKCNRLNYDECISQCNTYWARDSPMANGAYVCDFTCTLLDTVGLQIVMNADNKIGVESSSGESLPLLATELSMSDTAISGLILSRMNDLTEAEKWKLIIFAYKELRKSKKEMSLLEKDASGNYTNFFFFFSMALMMICASLWKLLQELNKKFDQFRETHLEKYTDEDDEYIDYEDDPWLRRNIVQFLRSIRRKLRCPQTANHSKNHSPTYKLVICTGCNSITCCTECLAGLLGFPAHYLPGQYDQTKCSNCFKCRKIWTVSDGHPCGFLVFSGFDEEYEKAKKLIDRLDQNDIVDIPNTMHI